MIGVAVAFNLILDISLIRVLEKAGFIKSPEGGFDVAHFVNTDIARLT